MIKKVVSDANVGNNAPEEKSTASTGELGSSSKIKKSVNS